MNATCPPDIFMLRRRRRDDLAGNQTIVDGTFERSAHSDPAKCFRLRLSFAAMVL